MRKWYLPMTVLGLGSLGVLLFTERGRSLLWQLRDFMAEAPWRLEEWNETAQEELDRIQRALNRVAESLEGLETAQ
jgi:hypothetical protein